MNQGIVEWMEERLSDVAKAWGVTPDAAARVLSGREYSEFWKNINADEFLNMRQGGMNKPETVTELIEDGLKRHSYDGLYNSAGCACKIGDLAPCGEGIGSCDPGVFTDEPCANCCGGKPCNFHIGRRSRLR